MNWIISDVLGRVPMRKKPTRPLTARWCREVLDSHAEAWLPLPRGLRATARQYDRRDEQLVSIAEQYAMTRPASAPLPGTQPASTCSLPGCDPPPSERRGPSHPDQIFLAYSRFSHLLKRNKTWDTSVMKPAASKPLLRAGKIPCPFFQHNDFLKEESWQTKWSL